MELKAAFGIVFRWFRRYSNLSQEDLAVVSGRTYISTLERGLNSPTIDKLDELAPVVGAHPLTLMLCAYAVKDGMTPHTLLTYVNRDLENFSLTDVSRSLDISPKPPRPRRKK